MPATVTGTTSNSPSDKVYVWYSTAGVSGGGGAVVVADVVVGCCVANSTATDTR